MYKPTIKELELQSDMAFNRFLVANRQYVMALAENETRKMEYEEAVRELEKAKANA